MFANCQWSAGDDAQSDQVSLLTRLRGDRGQRGTRRTLQYYFVAQDIHGAPVHRTFSTKRAIISL